MGREGVLRCLGAVRRFATERAFLERGVGAGFSEGVDGPSDWNLCKSCTQCTTLHHTPLVLVVPIPLVRKEEVARLPDPCHDLSTYTFVRNVWQRIQ